MNINVLLNIANHWNLPISDFFIVVDQNECDKDYFISSVKYHSDSNNDGLVVSEDSKIYKNTKKLSIEKLALKESKEREIALLQDLIANYTDRIELLQKELERIASGE